jgi:hypothetical protein
VRFLNPILAEHQLTCADRFLDDAGRDGLGDRDELHLCLVAAGGFRRKGDLLPHQAESGRDADAGSFLGPHEALHTA